MKQNEFCIKENEFYAMLLYSRNSYSKIEREVDPYNYMRLDSLLVYLNQNLRETPYLMKQRNWLVPASVRTNTGLIEEWFRIEETNPLEISAKITIIPRSEMDEHWTPNTKLLIPLINTYEVACQFVM